MTTGFANALLTAIDAGTVKANFKGVALGDSWISGIDYVDTWGPFLLATSLIDQNQADLLKQTTDQCDSDVTNGRWEEATNCWGKVEGQVDTYTDGVDFYNILIHNDPDALVSASASPADNMRHVLVDKLLGDDLDDLMNGQIKQQLGIPDNVTWGGQSNQVFDFLRGDFMKPVVDGVDALLKDGRLTVVIYNGQLDLICATPGTETWMKKLTWSGMTNFYKAAKVPLYAHGNKATDGFVKTYQNLTFYWIMNAGHMVPADNGNMALQMVHQIIGV